MHNECQREANKGVCTSLHALHPRGCLDLVWPAFTDGCFHLPLKGYWALAMLSHPPQCVPQAQSQLSAATDNSTESLRKKDENSASPKKSGSYALWFLGSRICSRDRVYQKHQACERKTKHLSKSIRTAKAMLPGGFMPFLRRKPAST